MIHKVVKVVENSNFLDVKLWLSEAQFGFGHVEEKIGNIKRSLKILEVGCGSGILLSMLAEEFSQHHFRGIEPFGDGFFSLTELSRLVRRMGVEIDVKGYEDDESNVKYDLIYCVNVFEHVENWQHFLNWAAERLTEGGVFLILCPNYSFPYESHFRIPIVWNKRLTYRIFKNYIENFEGEQNCKGLWKSLNFVKKREMKKFVEENKSSLGFQFVDEIQIIDHMVSRVITDDEFRKRQMMLGRFAELLQRVGILKVIKLIPNFLPYMKISLIKTG